MLRSIRYHLDHDINRNATVADALRRRGIDVTVSREVGVARVPDTDQIEYARREGRVLVTHDADFLGIGRNNPDHAGIVRCRQGEISLGDVVRGRVFIRECCTPEEMKGSIIFLNRGLIEGL